MKRTVLATVGVAGALTLAGCAEDGSWRAFVQRIREGRNR